MTNFKCTHCSSLFSEDRKLISEFLPSLFTAPDNHWTPDSDKQIALNPDPVSDAITEYEPCTTGKPRSKDVWRSFISIFDHPISKKDVEKESVYNPELEEKEKAALGEDETLLEYSKGFYDPKKHDFPHNTTWSDNSSSQGGEPYTPLPSFHVETNPENEAQNSPGGFPARFCRAPRSEWFSDEGEIVPALQNMWKNKKASINEFPLAGSSVDGRSVRNEVPNQSSIGSSLSDYTVLKGIREVPFSAFTQMPRLSYYSTDEEKRTKELAEQIKQTGEITPLIVAVDNQGPYILEGGHRFDALRELRANSFPAMVVLDNESLNKEAAIDSMTRDITAYSQESGGWISPEGEYIPTEDHLGYISNHPEVFGFKPEQVTSLKEADILMKAAIQNGWVTIRKWGDILAIVANSYYDARKAENEIFDMASQIKLIRIDTLYKQVFSANINDFMEQKWGAFLKQSVMAKQAGSYSASVPDYQGEEYYTEQHMNDTDCEPYINHDQRDYPYGMHDSPENTMSGIDWPKDQTSYVVRLDVLYPGPDRPFPFGMPDYETTIYPFTYPAGDGIEATNPD